MAYTLKSSGIATNLVVCVGVDEDGTTIKDFVGSTITLGTGVAASVATGSWKGTSRNYFATTANGTFGFFGVTWSSAPSISDGDADGLSVWMAVHGASANSAQVPYCVIDTSASNTKGMARVTGTGKAKYDVGGGTTAISTTTIPTDGTTKFSLGTTYRNSVSSTVLYGLESGSLALEATQGSDGGFGGANGVYTIGGATGQGNSPIKPYLFCVFNKILTTAEMQSLHGNGTDDWFSTLFNAGGGASIVGQPVFAAPIFNSRVIR
jgi:hypothetical protein